MYHEVMADSMIIVRDYEDLPAAIKDSGDWIPNYAGNLQHPYRYHPIHPSSGLWMAHCCNCGEYVDDFDEIPATDFLCDPCDEADVAEE